ncbi:MAG: hypothetical protein BroJett003_27890 [Planctomycetota bacterium]|nr:MAG: hypothetical protein BroJett003_27890 [Planctomycetota bacterium]
MTARTPRALYDTDPSERLTDKEITAPIELPGVPESAVASSAPGRPRRAFKLTVSALLLAAGGYALYERLGTRANADQVIRFESYGDDAVAIGLTDQQPGFVLLSHLPASRVMVDAQVATNWLTGKHTILSVRTPDRNERIRLRAPLAILVPENGTILAVNVEWSHADFQSLVHAADCESGCEAHPHRCGQPLAEIASALANWPVDRVPQAIREFVAVSNR